MYSNRSVLYTQTVAEYTYSENVGIGHEAHSVNLRQAFNELEAEVATFKIESAIGVTTENVPSLPTGASCLSWWQIPSSSLGRLLALARRPEGCRTIPEVDIQYIVKCCNYDGYFPFSESRKLAKTAIRILSYIAQHQWLLSPDAIAALKTELRRKESKTVHNAVLALSYAAHHQKEVTSDNDIKALLVEGVLKLKELARKEDDTTRVIAYSALAKLNHRLDLSDLTFIRSCLTGAHALPAARQTLSSVFPQGCGLAFWRTPGGEIDLVKSVLKEGKKKLYKDQLLFVERLWDDSDLKRKTRISYLIRQSICNGQIVENKSKYFDILSESLFHPERKIKNNAIISATKLVENSMVPADHELWKKLREARVDCCLHAVRALISYHKNGYRLDNASRWVEIISGLSGSDQLESYSRYFLYLIQNNLQALLSLLLNPKYAIEASMAFLDTTIREPRANVSILGSLPRFFDGDYPFEAKLNIVLAITEMLKLEVNIQQEVITSISRLIDTKNFPLANGALLFLATCTTENLAVIAAHKTDPLCNLLRTREVSHNASYLLAMLVERVLTCIQPISINNLINVSSFLLTDKHCDIKVKKNICRILLTLAKSQASFMRSNLFDNLSRAIDATTDEAMKKQLLLTVGFMVENSEESVALPQRLIDFLVDGLSEASEEWRNTSKYILCMYISKMNIFLIEDVINRITDYLFKHDTLIPACEILEQIAKHAKLTPKAIIALASLLAHPLLEVRGLVARILFQSRTCEFPVEAIEKMEVGLSDFSPYIVETLLTTLVALLESRIFRQELPTNTNRLERLLADIARHRIYQQQTINMNAMIALFRIASHRKRLNFDILIDVLPVLASSHAELRQQTADLFLSQVPYFILSIKNKNPSVHLILDGIQEYIQDNNIIVILMNITIIAQKNGYVLSEKNTLKIGEFLQYHKERAIRKLAYSILKECQILPKSLGVIVQLEEASHVLLSHTKTEKEKRSALQCFRKAIRQRHLLTSQCFDALEATIDDQSKLKSAAVEICLFAIQSGQKISQSLFDTMIKIVTYDHSNINDISKMASLIICEIVSKEGYYFSQETYESIESIFINSEKNTVYFDFIEVGLKRGYQLSDLCLNKIIDFILNYCQICHRALRVLKCSEEKISSECLIKLTKIVPDIFDLDLRKDMANFIKYQIDETGLSVDSDITVELRRTLLKRDNLLLEKQAFEILLSQNKRKMISPDMSELLLLKNQELILLDDESSIESKVQSIEFLINKQHVFKQRDINNIIFVCDQLFSFEHNDKINLLEGMLNSISQMSFKKCIFSHDFVESLISMLSSSLVQLHSPVLLSMEYLIRCQLVSHEDLDKLNKLITFRSSPIRYILEHESSDLPVSIENIKEMCLTIESYDNKHQGIAISILMRSKENIPAEHYKELLVFIIKKVTDISETFPFEESVGFFLYLITQDVLPKEDLHYVLLLVDQQFRLGGICHFVVEIAEYCIIRFSNFYLKSVEQYIKAEFNSRFSDIARRRESIKLPFMLAYLLSDGSPKDAFSVSIRKLLCSILPVSNEKYLSKLVQRHTPKEINHFLLLLRMKQRREGLTAFQVDDALCMLSSYTAWVPAQDMRDQLILCSLEENKVLWIRDIFIYENIIMEIYSFNWECKLIYCLIEFFKLSNDEDFLSFLIFIKKYAINEQQLEELVNDKETDSIEQLHIFLLNELLDKKIRETIPEKNQYEIENAISVLLSKGWDFDKIYDFLDISNIEARISALEIACFYKIKEEEFFDLYHKLPLENFSSALHRIFIEHFLDAGGELSLAEVSDRIQETLQELNPEILPRHYELMTILQESTELYKKTGPLPSGYKAEDSISAWSKDDIPMWAYYTKELRRQSPPISEILAIMRRAYFLHSKETCEPRPVQFLAVLYLLDAEISVAFSGRFAQVHTGEGKSLIIAMLATVFCLKNELVDIITSSPVLAHHDASEYRKFYRLFDIKADTNEDYHYVKGQKSCYKEDVQIIYGDARHFSFDILREEYSGLGTRGDRAFGNLIIDEVDNVLIDEVSNIALLSSFIPGMHVFMPILGVLWQELNHIVQTLLIEEEERVEISFLRDKLTAFYKKVVHDQKIGYVEIPAHLKEFVDYQSTQWIENIILAYDQYKEKRNYTIELDHLNQRVIIPVDYTNTGILQDGSSLGDGLQMILQFKHGLRVSPENLITNFISILSLVAKYKKIYGITGTLGSLSSQKLLRETYHVDFVKFPTYKERRFLSLPCEIIEDEYWQSTIINRAIREARKGRAVLVVCESIASARHFFEKISESYEEKEKVHEYSKNINQERISEEVISPGTIFVMTTLGGRGLDLKLNKETVNNGGLHVIGTFLPVNEPVEQQLFGRAARKGEIGSGQLILNEAHVSHIATSSSDDVDQIKVYRNQKEQKHLDRIQGVEIPCLIEKGRVFKDYLELRNKLQEIDKDDTNFKIILLHENIDVSLLPDFSREMSRFKKLAVEELWGIWLKHSESSFSSRVNFYDFERKILEEYKTNKIIKNPVYFIRLANYFIGKTSEWMYLLSPSKKKEFLKLAIAFYRKAIEIDPSSYSHVAYYNISYALIRISSLDYKKESKRYIKSVQNFITEKLLPRLQAFSNVAENIKQLSDHSFHEDFSEKIHNDIQVLNTLHSSAQLAIEAIEKSQSLFSLSFESKETESVFQRLDGEQAIETLNRKKRARSASVTLMGSKKHDDIGDCYPLTDMIRRLGNGFSSVNVIFYGTSLELDGGLNHTLRRLLPINRRMNEEEQKKTGDNSSDQEPEQLISNREYIAYARKKLFSAFTSVGKGVSGVTSQAARPFLAGFDFLYGYTNAEEISVSLELYSLSIQKAKSILQPHSDYRNNGQEEYILILHDINNQLLNSIKKYRKNGNIYVLREAKESEHSSILKSHKKISEVITIDEYCDIKYVSSSISFVL